MDIRLKAQTTMDKSTARTVARGIGVARARRVAETVVPVPKAVVLTSTLAVASRLRQNFRQIG